MFGSRGLKAKLILYFALVGLLILAIGGSSFVALSGAARKWSTQESLELSQIKPDLESIQMTTLIVTAFSCLFVVMVGVLLAMHLERRLRALSSGAQLTAHDLEQIARDVSASSGSLSERATAQAAALQETVASIEQVSAMIGKTADNASRSNAQADSARQVADKGKAAVDRMIASIDEIDQSNSAILSQVEAGNGQISEIVRMIGEISTKTKVINDIVFQTKLLSFNASVEAARAGEQGKGFAVVAQEIGNLAQMSGAAAEEISSLLESSTKNVEKIVSDMRLKIQSLVVLGKEKVASGSLTAKQCSEIFEQMVNDTEAINRMIKEISVASAEQAQGIQEINRAMTELDQMTQSNARAAQEALHFGEKLKTQHNQVQGVVKDLSSLVQGGVAQPPPALPAQSAVMALGKPTVKTQPKLSLVTSKPVTVFATKTKEVSQPKVEKPHAKVIAGASQHAKDLSKIPDENDPRFEDV